MLWSVTLYLIAFAILICSVDGILAFTFCAIVSFVFARTLLNGENNLDYTAYFSSKGFVVTKKQGNLVKTSRKPFPSALERRRDILIQNILRDFVISWYENVGVHDAFIVETRSLIEEAICTLYDRLSNTSVKTHIEKLSLVYHRHLSDLQSAKKHSENHKSIVECICSQYKNDRPNLSDESQHILNIVDLLLFKLVPKKTFSCDIGRLILREILTFNVLLPFIETISQPDFVNITIINIFGEGISEVDETSTMEVTSAAEQNFNISSVFKEYLKENIDWKENDKQVESKQLTTKFKFNNLTVAEENHTDLVDYSMENDLHDQSFNSIFRSDSDDLNDFNDKESTSFELFSKQANEKNNVNRKKEEVEGKDSTQILSINDSDKAKNQPNKEKKLSILNSLFTSKSRSMLTKTLRKTNSSPNLKTSGSRKWLHNKENISKIPDNDELSSFSSEEETSSCFSSSGNVTQTNLKSESLQEPKRMDSSEFFDKVNSNDKVFNNSVDDCLVNEVFAKCNDVPVVSVCGDNLLPDRHGEQLIKMFEESQKNVNCNVSSKNSFLDFGNYDGGLVEDKTGWKKLERNLQDHGILEETPSDGKDNTLIKSTQTVIDIKGNDLSVKERQIEDDMISRAEFAINDMVNLCSMINIPSTELIYDHSFESYKRKYTVYLIKYNLHLWGVIDDEKDEELGGVNQIKRRYREFMELHHRLVCGALSDYMKDIPKPNRKFNSPFFRLDEDVIKGRQFLLENYLKCLVNKPAILNSEDFKGFLGIGEKNKTDFRRPLVVVPTLPQVPRIDKKLKENMAKFLDHIKTAFDSGPVNGEEDYDYEGLMFGDDKTTQDDIRSFVFCSTDSQVNHSCFDSFLRHQITDEHEAQVSYSANFKFNGLDKDLSRMKEAEKSQMSKNVQPLDSYKTGLHKDEGATNPLTKAVLNLSCHFLEKQRNWVCLEPVQEAATAVFGCFIEWWMEGYLSDLVSEEQWQYYLKLLTDSVWPGGRLVKIKKDQKNVEEILKNREKAVTTLVNVLTGIFHSTIGAEIIEECAEEIVDSFQYPEINRQLLLEMFEVILIEVFPEFPEDKKDYLRTI